MQAKINLKRKYLTYFVNIIFSGMMGHAIVYENFIIFIWLYIIAFK